MTSLRDVIAVLDAQFPFSRVESWDRVGLQIGDANAPVARVLVAHEVTDETLDRASDFDALVVYHPLLFRALENLDFANHSARLSARCIRQNLSVVAVHTALDHASPPRALGDSLARALGLNNIQVLSPSGRETLNQIVVFVPPESMPEVSEAMWQAGAGQIGHYDRAGFRSDGYGTFRPLEGAHPTIGSIGQDQTVIETRLEMIVPTSARDAVLRAMREAHPYEEIAHAVYPLHNTLEAFGSARTGKLAAPIALDDWAQQVGRILRAPNARVVRGTKSEVASVACVAGAGASFIGAIARAGIDCLVTGDIKHHEALQARALGLSIVDVTHTATERAAVSLIADALDELADVEIVRCEWDTNPFEAV